MSKYSLTDEWFNRLIAWANGLNDGSEVMLAKRYIVSIMAEQLALTFEQPKYV